MGRLQPSLFPSVFGLNGDLPLDADAARSRFQELAETMKTEMGGERAVEDIAAGYLQIAVENMANAIKEISIRRGYDVTEYALCCFGGAGGQHACLIADTLGMETVFIHPYAGVLSAYGMGLADIRSVKERSIELSLDQHALLKIQSVLAELGDEAKAEIQPQLTDSDNLRVEERLHVRYDGTDSSLEISLPQSGDIAAEVRRAFEDEHRKRYGFIMEGKALVVAVAVAEAIGETDVVEEKAQEISSNINTAPIANHSVYIGGSWKEIPFYSRE
jgi:5-oxoprolinase (ATP-hydrolysing)